MKFLSFLRQQTAKAFCSQPTRVWRLSLGGTEGESVNSAGYSLIEYPINAREKHYPLFWYILRDGPLENLWGGVGEVQKKNIRARENLINEKNSCT